MAKRHLPSIETLTSSDDERLITELRLSEVREQVAHAKELLDAVDVFVPLADPGQVSASEQGKAVTPAVAEQLARLGCRIVEIASALSKVSDVSPRSSQQLRAATT